jgi:type III secretion system low calcium response chaperone LcrH/SycD
MQEKMQEQEMSLVNLTNHVLQGATFGDINGITAEKREAIYSIAYLQFNQRNYKEALKLFKLLVYLDHLDRRFVKGLGSCLQMLGMHEEAIKLLSLAVFMEPEDPTASLQVAQCFLAQGKKDQGKEILERLRHEFGNHEKFSDTSSKVNAILELINDDEKKLQ